MMNNIANIQNLMKVEFKTESQTKRAIRYALSSKRPARPLYADNMIVCR